MDQFYKDLVEKIRYAAEKDIQKIMGETGGEKIYASFGNGQRLRHPVFGCKHIGVSEG